MSTVSHSEVSGNFALVCVHIVKHFVPTIKTKAHKYMYRDKTKKIYSTARNQHILIIILSCKHKNMSETKVLSV